MPGPVFIVGLSHTGKTELRRALVRGDGIRLTRKTDLWGGLRACLTAPTDPSTTTDFIDALAAWQGATALDVDTTSVRDNIEMGEDGISRLLADVHARHATRSGYIRWGSQEQGALEWATEILDQVDGAMFIHMVRHPLARLVSIGRVSVRTAPQEVGRWNWSAERAWTLSKSFPTRYRVARYEDLVADPAEMIRNLTTWVGISYVPSMSDELVETAARAARRIGSPILTRALVTYGTRDGRDRWDYPADPLKVEPRSVMNPDADAENPSSVLGGGG